MLVSYFNIIRRLLLAFFYAGWVAFSLLGVTFTILLSLFAALKSLGVDMEYFSKPQGLLILFALQFVLALSVVSLYPLIKAKWRFSKLKADFGVTRKIAWRDLYLPVIVFPLYFIVSTSIVLLIGRLFPGVNLDQAQDVGFKSDILTNVFEYALAFIALVVLAPIAEELLFRGYLFSKTRFLIGSIGAALLTSLTFGAMHGQLNVGIDTFVLSLFLCGLRYKTDAIWASMVLHSLKNFLAYMILFIGPLFGLSL